MGYDQFGKLSGVLVMNGKPEMIHLNGIKQRRWNMSKDDLVFLGFLNNSSACSIQTLKKLLHLILCL